MKLDFNFDFINGGAAKKKMPNPPSLKDVAN